MNNFFPWSKEDVALGKKWDDSAERVSLAYSMFPDLYLLKIYFTLVLYFASQIAEIFNESRQ